MLGFLKRKTKKVSVSKAASNKQKPKIQIMPVGTVVHYYGKIHVAIIEIENDCISLGDILFIKGHSTRFRQRVKSIEYNHQQISKAPEGYQIGLQVGAKTKTGDKVYKELNA